MAAFSSIKFERIGLLPVYAKKYYFKLGEQELLTLSFEKEVLILLQEIAYFGKGIAYY